MNEQPDIFDRTVPSLEANPAKAATNGPNTIQNSASTGKAPDPELLEGTLRQGLLECRSSSVISLRRGDVPTVEGYSLQEKLGEGTYGVVYRAVEATTGRTVAIKFYHSKMGEMWQLVWAEVKQLAMLDSVQGIVQLKDAEPSAEPPYFVMNYAEGGSLAARIRKGKMGVGEALPLFKQTVEALSYVHAKGIRHCDLKPANILLDALGKPLIADFGQAHLSVGSETVSGNLGTFFYMAPDQADLDKQIPDTRWDVYSLGAIFYCMLTGRPPRASVHLTEELKRTVHLDTRLKRYRDGVAGAPAPREHRQLPGMDRSLAAIVEKCLHLDPAQRYQNASEVYQALLRRERYQRQRPALILGMAATLLLIFGLGAVSWTMLKTSVREAKESIIEQLKPSDETAVNMMANVVADRLETLMDSVEGVADKTEYIETFQPFLERLASLDPAAITDKSFRKAEDCKRAQEVLDKVSQPGVRHWVLYDLKGNFLAASYAVRRGRPKEDVANQVKYAERYEELYGTSLRHRDFYHGQGGDNYTAPYKRGVFVSEPYESTLKTLVGEKPVTIGVTAPIYPLAKKGDKEPNKKAEPVGLLVGFVDMTKDVANWLSGVRFANGSALLLNHHGQCIHHSRLKAKELFERKDGFLRKRDDFLKLVAASEAGEQLKADEQLKAGEQLNLGEEGNLCLPRHAYLPSRNKDRKWEPTQWVALIVHDQDQVFGQVERLQEKLSLIIVIAGGILLLTVAGLWLWLLRNMRGEAIR
jgi:hypothetical protein